MRHGVNRRSCDYEINSNIQIHPIPYSLSINTDYVISNINS